MAWQAIAAAALPFIGGFATGRGAVDQNASNKDTKTRLGWQIENLRQLADPVGGALYEGYSPTGWLTAATKAAGRIPIETGVGANRGTLRSNAWRFGGSGSGLPKAMWKDINVKGATDIASSDMASELEAMDVQARIDALNRGYSRAFNPETIYENEQAWIGDAVKALSQGYDAGAGSGRF